MVGFKVNRLNV